MTFINRGMVKRFLQSYNTPKYTSIFYQGGTTFLL